MISPASSTMFFMGRLQSNAPGSAVVAWLNVTALVSLYLCAGTLIPGRAAGLRTDGGQLVDMLIASRRSTAAWAAAEPALLLETDELTPPEYEVRVYDKALTQSDVATISDGTATEPPVLLVSKPPAAKW
jgi:hypothetical protein